MLPPSTAYMPLALAWLWYQASIAGCSPVTAAPVATECVVIGLPEAFTAFSAPSMRGCRFAEPGVAMNSPTSPEPTAEAIRSPIFSPAFFRSWPM